MLSVPCAFVPFPSLYFACVKLNYSYLPLLNFSYRYSGRMKRILILGRGGAGKTTLAHAMAERLQIEHINLDSMFWQPDLTPTPADRWREKQQELIAKNTWILDGDLGPYDEDIGSRIAASDTIVVLDYPLGLCAWRTLRRGPENSDYWRWLLSYRLKHLPRIKRLIQQHSPHTNVHYIHSPWGIPDLLNRTAALPK